MATSYLSDEIAARLGTGVGDIMEGNTFIPTDGVAVLPLDADPDTETRQFALTRHDNCPDTTNYWHIRTQAYGGNKAQIAIQYSGGIDAYVRNLYSGTWSAWIITT